MKYKVVGMVNGNLIQKIYEHKYQAEEAMSTLNEIFAPFSVEEAGESEKKSPIVTSLDNGIPF